jgi:hypothetical protein
MTQDTSDKKMTVDLRTGRKLVFTIVGANGVDSEQICITITHEAKAGRVARLNVVAPPIVRIGFP